MPLMTSMTGIFFAANSFTTLARPSAEMAPITTAFAPRETQSSSCETCFARFVYPPAS
jgi:hypothetical protein